MAPEVTYVAFVFLVSCAGQGVYHATGAIQLDDNGVRGDKLDLRD